MNGKENVLAALSFRQPLDYVPVWELEFQAWDNLSGKEIYLGQKFCNLSEKEKDSAIHSNAEIIIETCIDLHFSALTTINNYWEVAPGHPSYSWLPDDWRSKQNVLLRQLCEKEGIAIAGTSGGCITMPGDSNFNGDNYIEFCCRLIEEPECIDEWAENVYKGGVENARKLRDMGYDIAITCSDIADNKGPFFSPAQMDRWFFPYLHKWTQEVEEMGMYTVLHTDGDVTPLLDGLMESRLHGLQAIDSLAGMDIEHVKKITAGKLCLCGNTPTGLLVKGPPECVFESTRDLLQSCKDGGGLIFGTSNAVVDETPAENYRQMIEAWKVYGQYDIV